MPDPEMSQRHSLGSSCSGLTFSTARIPLHVVRRERLTRCCKMMTNSVPRVNGRTLISIAACSAVLGPLLDNYHSQFGILTYKNPMELHLDIAGLTGNLTTAPFTSPLFVLAGLIIAYGTLALNSSFIDRRFPVSSITGPQALATIAAFSSIYYLSAVIPNSQFAPITGPLLTLLGFAEWYLMDRSVGGLIMGLMTGVCGPLVEVGLINIGNLYSYSSPEVLGIPLFIGAVYFAGGPAVGNLARAIEEHGNQEWEKGKS